MLKHLSFSLIGVLRPALNTSAVVVRKFQTASVTNKACKMLSRSRSIFSFIGPRLHSAHLRSSSVNSLTTTRTLLSLVSICMLIIYEAFSLAVHALIVYGSSSKSRNEDWVVCVCARMHESMGSSKNREDLRCILLQLRD